MKRSRFLASLAALAAVPFVQVDKAPAPPPPVITDPQHFTRIATVDKYIIGLDPYKEEWSSPEKILQMYHETGVLVWKKEPGGEVEWKPIQVIERNGKV